jgi:hypothetical protein
MRTLCVWDDAIFRRLSRCSRRRRRCLRRRRLRRGGLSSHVRSFAVFPFSSFLRLIFSISSSFPIFSCAHLVFFPLGCLSALSALSACLPTHCLPCLSACLPCLSACLLCLSAYRSVLLADQHFLLDHVLLAATTRHRCSRADCPYDPVRGHGVYDGSDRRDYGR